MLNGDKKQGNGGDGLAFRQKTKCPRFDGLRCRKWKIYAVVVDDFTYAYWKQIMKGRVLKET